MNLHIFKNKEILSDKLAEWISEFIAETLKQQEFFTLVLSGGSTPKILYEKLASGEHLKKINWKRIHIFWGDERVVPFTDERNNAKMAFEVLLNHVDIPADQVHVMRTDIEPNFASIEYSKILHHYFDHTMQSFDLVLLGMGDDGHTLSLFPGSSIIEDHENWVNSVYNKTQEMYRITIMPVIVNKSSRVAFMVEGEKKAMALHEVLEGNFNPSQFPSQIIKPANGELYWFVDKAAAENLRAF